MVLEWRSVIAVSMNVGGGVRLIKPAKLCMSTYNRMFRFNLFIHFLIFITLCQNDCHSFSVLIFVQQNDHLSSNITVRNYSREVLLRGKSGKANIFVTFWMILSLLYIVSTTWLVFLLLEMYIQILVHLDHLP